MLAQNNGGLGILTSELALRCVVSSEPCRASSQTHIIADSYVIIPANITIKQLSSEVIGKLKIDLTNHTLMKVLVVLPHWNPLRLEDVTECADATVDELFRPILHTMVLKLCVKNTENDAGGKIDIKDKLLTLLLTQTSNFLQTTNCPIDKETLIKILQDADVSEDKRRLFNVWYSSMATKLFDQVFSQQKTSGWAGSASVPDCSYLAGDSTRRNRISFDSVNELPRLLEWYNTNPRPGRAQMHDFLSKLNKINVSLGRRLLQYHNIKYWFKNMRALANKRKAPLNVSFRRMDDEAFCPEKKERVMTEGDSSSSESEEDDDENHVENELEIDLPLDSNRSAITVDPNQFGRPAEKPFTCNTIFSENENPAAETEEESIADKATRENQIISFPNDPESRLSHFPDADHSKCVLDLSLRTKNGDSFHNDKTHTRSVKSSGALKRELFDADSSASAQMPKEIVFPMSDSLPPSSDESTTALSSRQFIFDSSNKSPTESMYWNNRDEEDDDDDNGCGPNKKRIRVYIHPQSETPLLEKWYMEDSHPTWDKIERYCQILNSLSFRSSNPSLKPKNIRFWFKNYRAKLRRMQANSKMV